MPPSPAALALAIEPGMAGIGREEWDALLEPADRPLLSWGFLALLEESGSIVPEAGWTALHFLARRAGRLVAAAPFYARTGSWGDFVFDFEIAQAAEAAGAAYYPKLVGAVPATPAPAWRPLVAPGEDRPALEALLLSAAEQAARKAGFGALQLSWPDPDFAQRVLARTAGASPVGRRWRAWGHQAFLWRDSGYGDFAGYLAAFSKNMRRNVGRERAAVAAAGLETRILGPAEAGPAVLARMADLYESHNDKFGPWAARFLTRDFFLRLPEFLDGGWALAAASEGGGPPLALAFLLEGPERLYGRHWGSGREIPGLHFELCYYKPLEYALERGIGSFDPGMGSPHKAARGFASLVVPSLHLAFDRRVDALLAAVLPEASAEAEREAALLNGMLPFKRGPGGPGAGQAGSTTL
ncbi:MAG TPA: GNAT family N-acetyltransferase [Spirochaetia bacterium]|nr:GNAT family N-acetyltransferase [Spirochaetia bacterium]